MRGEDPRDMLEARIVVLWLCWAAAGGVRPAPLAVPRCCPPAHELEPAALLRPALRRADALAACRPAGAERAAWAPRVYAPARGLMLEPGRMPAHWRLADAALPACEELRVLPEHSAPYALLANNGSLWVRGRGAAPLPPDRYCADAAAALVCAEDARAPVASKCCAAARAFDGSRCVEAAEEAAAAAEQLRALAGDGEVAVGWPACGEGPRYAVAGALSGARLEGAGGALWLGEERLGPGAWCAEAVLGSSGARVLACEAAARATRPEAPLRHALYGAGLAVGALFLAATLAAGFALPAAHHALHWRCQTHYVAALMLGDALLAGTQLAGDAVPPTLCRALGESPPRSRTHRRWICPAAGRFSSVGPSLTSVFSVCACAVRSSCVYAFPVSVGILLAEYDVFQHLVDFPVSLITSSIYCPTWP